MSLFSSSHQRLLTTPLPPPPPQPRVPGPRFFWNLPVNHRGPGSAHKITSQQM